MSAMEKHRIEVPGGGLEAVVARDDSAPNNAMVVLHPYGPLGGCMDDPVVQTVFRTAAGSGLFRRVLRYNMRGVGSSTSRPIFGGPSDADDVARAVASITDRDPGSEQRIFLVGYSWGSCVATAALSCEGVAAYVAIGFPQGRLASLFLGSQKFWSCCFREEHHRLPMLFIIGTHDQFGNSDEQSRRIEEARDTGADAEIQIWEGFDHFFGGPTGRGRTQLVAVIDWIRQRGLALQPH